MIFEYLLMMYLNKPITYENKPPVKKNGIVFVTVEPIRAKLCPQLFKTEKECNDYADTHLGWRRKNYITICTPVFTED